MSVKHDDMQRQWKYLMQPLGRWKFQATKCQMTKLPVRNFHISIEHVAIVREPEFSAKHRKPVSNGS